MRLEGFFLWLQVEALQLSCCLQAISLRQQSRCSSWIGDSAEDLQTQEATRNSSARGLLPKQGVWRALEWFPSLKVRKRRTTWHHLINA